MLVHFALHPRGGPAFPGVGSQLSKPTSRLAPRAQASELVSWTDVAQQSKDARLNGYTVLAPGSKPATAPQRVLQTSLDSVWSVNVDTKHSVLLIRDTDGWCPFCERVWLALEWKGVDYDTMLISLRNKPDWFKELSPTGQVPVAKIGDRLVHESFDILKALEEEFPEPPLLPAESDLREEALRACDGVDDFAGAGYALMTGRHVDAAAGSDPGEPDGAQGAGFEGRLDGLEQLLAKHGGPFIMGEDLSLADIVYVSSLERLAALLPSVCGLRMRDNPAYPRLGDWYRAMDALPAYQAVKSDDRTLQLLIRKIFGVKDRFVPEVDARTAAARLEAAAKIERNHVAVLDDILNNSGILRVRSNQYGGTVRALNGYPQAPGPALVGAVDHALRRVCHYLVHGTPGVRHDCREACAIGSAALVFFRNRASAPRDLSAAAADELRHACSEILQDMY